MQNESTCPRVFITERKLLLDVSQGLVAKLWDVEQFRCEVFLKDLLNRHQPGRFQHSRCMGLDAIKRIFALFQLLLLCGVFDPLSDC